MYLNNYSNRHDLLIDWLLETVTPKSRVLDVGANDGSFCPEVARLAPKVAVFSGVDPDLPKLKRNPFLHQRFEGTLEDADIPHESFDVAYAFYVFEHVANPGRFIEAAARILRPGGSFFFIAPNAQHYFAKIAGLLASTGLQERALRLLRPDQLVDRYHYPALYRLNHPKVIERIGREYGFNRFEYRYSESFDEVSVYFPGLLKVFPWTWERLVQVTGREALLCNIMGRMTKRSG